MKKQSINLWLFAALLCGLSLSVTSCKDDDKGDDNSSEAAEVQASENANTFWAVAGNLVGTLNITSDYADKTFEPIIGEASEDDDATRVVILPDVEAAAAHFAAIVDADVTESTPTYTYKNDAVGTLVYTKSTDGKSLATVDVDIKQIPHLQKIVYKTADQMDINATNDGIPYYSFGDVIKRTRAEDNVEEYWICIQAPFTKQGSTDVIWATVSKLPSANIFKYTSKKGHHDYAIPTKLLNNKEYMKDLTELISAMSEPTAWLYFLEKGPNNMKAFNLVKKENVKYLNKTFWTTVKNGWVKNDLANKIFGSELSALNNKLNNDGMKFVYHGYSWYYSVSDNLSLYVSTVKSGTGAEANARHLEWVEVKKDVITPYIAVDCLSQLQKGSQWINEAFFGDNEPRYIFRFSTSRDLYGKKIGIYETLATPGGIEDVHVYTRDNGIAVGATKTMENYTQIKDDNDDDDDDDEEAGIDDDGSPVSDANIKVGYYIAADGKIYKTKKTSNNHGGAVAVVVYLGGNKRVEDGQDWNGLAMSLEKEDTYWEYEGTEAECKDMTHYETAAEALKTFNGFASTDILKKCTKDSHDHKVLVALASFDKVETSQNQMSSWFVPSLGQFLLAVEGLGGKYNEEDEAFELPDNDNPYFADVSTLLSEGTNITSTVSGDTEIYGFNVEQGIKVISKDAKKQLLPFIAFKYGDGGKQNQNR